MATRTIDYLPDADIGAMVPANTADVKIGDVELHWVSTQISRQDLYCYVQKCKAAIIQHGL